MLSNLLLVLASTAALVNSQSTSSIDPNSVDIKTRQYWCSAQKSACPLLCLQIASGVPESNNCTAETLTYSCVCSNGISPNASEYSQTLPYFICTEANNQCVNACSDSACQSRCRTANPCGAQNPPRVNVTSTASSSVAATSTAASNVIQTGGATGAAPRGVSVEMSQVYGLCVLVGGVVAGFAVLL
ncbi:uncharacterized protein N7473_012771 [Penicillium subrubescens]|uniref:DUF7707 domain-containing protein n=1 Tax=Penicillium subrubescens TaxID=1316194 RepID=A0A1Q5UGH4_9EURO|nr:uncharacterized protein N7473_012771 [Penicillium subrubescens]KAJ5875424.1 hypothetical protein N7473_012771 [Penicillium subrubescens]OKP11587.1 hypothetical protein PENSUB_2889 [Penicillium subrubescens]